METSDLFIFHSSLKYTEIFSVGGKGSRAPAANSFAALGEEGVGDSEAAGRLGRAGLGCGVANHCPV